MSNQTTAQDAFLKAYHQMQEDMKRIQEKMDNHMDTDANSVDWGDVGSMEHLAHNMREICDQAYQEGEYEPAPSK